MLQKMALLVTALGFSILMSGQVHKGDKMVGASVGSIFFTNGTTDLISTVNSTTSNDNFGISFTPSYGWFVTDNLAVGIAPTLSFGKQKVLGKSSNGNTYLKDETSQYNFGVGGFGRYYFSGTGEALRIFGQFNLAFGLNGSKKEGYEYETLGVYVDRYNQKSSGDLFVNVGPSLGVSKFFNNHTALDISLGYTFSYVKSNPTGTFLRDYSDPATGDETQNINYDQKFSGHNIMLAVGYQVFLGKKK